MRLSPQQIAALLKATENSFDPDDMKRLLLERFGLRLHSVTSEMIRFGAQVVNIHNHFDAHNITEQFVAALRDARPRESTFLTLADELGFTQLPCTANLEVLIHAPQNPFKDVADFRAGLSMLESAVCRVEVGNTGYGTGVLVGCDMVLTNHHVFSSALNNEGGLNQVINCLFDHKKAAQGLASPARRVRVAGVLACSPPVGDEYTEWDVHRLDYGLLKLDHNIGAQPIVAGGETRGFVQIEQAVGFPAVSDGLIILQHPLAQQMKIDIGSVTATTNTRIRHSVNTLDGSSGAPIFDASLRMVALHHAGFDRPAGRAVNQAIPVALIAADARSKGVDI